MKESYRSDHIVNTKEEKTMPNEVIPEISEEFKNKTFGASNIKWVKTVNDKKTYSAYLPPDCPYNRVIERPDGEYFCLQANGKFRNSLSMAYMGDLILLYQYLGDPANKEKVKCFTHLVSPIDNTVVPNPYGGEWPGRWVKVIAMTKSRVVSSIRFENTIWSTIGFTNNVHRSLSYQNGSIREINPDQQLSAEQLLRLQNNIWDKFDWKRCGLSPALDDA
jgi:hypothetical protein